MANLRHRDDAPLDKNHVGTSCDRCGEDFRQHVGRRSYNEDIDWRHELTFFDPGDRVALSHEWLPVPMLPRGSRTIWIACARAWIESSITRSAHINYLQIQRSTTMNRVWLLAIAETGRDQLLAAAGWQA